MKDLTNSQIERRNILNNNFAVQEIYSQTGFHGILFDGEYHFTRQQVTQFFGIDERTIERLLEQHSEELTLAGYKLLKGKRLKDFKDVLTQLTDIDVGQLNQLNVNELVGARTPALSLFTFKALLNLAMLLTVSERARQLRSLMLNIVIDVLNEKLGGSTKFINQREEEYLPSAIREYNYRKEFTTALNLYIENDKSKYGILTDKVYICIFNENAKEYKQILKLAKNDSARETMYSEVLDLIAGFENGFADYLKKESAKIGRQLSVSEAQALFENFSEQMESFCQPLREKARTLMASRDMAFRDALHVKLEDYVGAVSSEDFDKFLGERSKAFELRLEENKEVFLRLKDR